MEHYVGIDVSLELSSVCVVDGRGKIVKEGRRWSLALCPDEIGSNTMPLDLIWLVAVVTAFAIFAGTLFWADRRTRKLNK